MGSERHRQFEEMIDRSLAMGLPADDEGSLRQHLESCVLCQEYWTATTRAIAGLGGFSFEVHPALQAKISAAIAERAGQIKGKHWNRRRLVAGWIIALLLTAAGSILELQCSGVIAAALDLGRAEVREGLIAIWIVPSLCFLLLFPVLPLLARAGTYSEERTL